MTALSGRRTWPNVMRRGIAKGFEFNQRACAAFALILFGYMPLPSTANLLLNPGFETAGTTVSNAFAWESGNPDSHGGIWGNASRENWRSHSGEWQATIKTTWGGTLENFGGWWQEVPASAGEAFQATAWFWADSTWSAGSPRSLPACRWPTVWST